VKFIQSALSSFAFAFFPVLTWAFKVFPFPAVRSFVSSGKGNAKSSTIKITLRFTLD
jgi:hypothetical protein